MVLVYRYGLRPPTANEALVRSQMRLAHAYRNTLVGVERERRGAIRDLASKRGDEVALLAAYAAADGAVVALVREAKAHASATRSRKAPTELATRLRDAKETRVAALRAVKAHRRALRDDPSFVESAGEIDARAETKQRETRAACGVYWGSYLPVEAAARQARMAPLYDGVEPNDPHFVRWDGRGTIAVQFQGGLTVGELLSCADTRARVVAPAAAAVTDAPPAGWGSLRYSDAERLARWRRTVLHGAPKPCHTLFLRVGSDGRAPVWASWPLILHRPLPEGATLKWAHVHLVKVGPREEWSVTLTIDVPEQRERCGEGTVAIDLGWRRMADGSIRVATAEDEAGTVRELRLDADAVQGLSKADEIRGVRDTHFDLARAWYRMILDGLDAVPEWLTEAVRTMASWRAQGRLAAVAIRWRGARFDGDEAAFAALEAWRIKDKHLWCWEANQRAGALRRRKDVYRVFAAGLARVYRTVVLEDFDLRAFARRPAAGDAESVRDERARAQRHFAATSELRLAIIQAFAGRGGEEAQEPAADTTRECSTCSVVESFEAGTEVRHTCKNGHEWDQDENACRNLLKRWRKRSGGAEDAVTDRAGDGLDGAAAACETTWAKRRRKKSEKLIRTVDRTKTEAQHAIGVGQDG